MLSRHRYNSRQSCHKPRRWYFNRRGTNSITCRRHIYWLKLKVRISLTFDAREKQLNVITHINLISLFAATPAAAAIIEKETEYAGNLETLPPPAPPIVTITNSGKIQHDQPFVLTSRPSVSSNNTQAAEVYGCLRYKDNVLYITEHSIEIGRNSSTSTVHFHVGKNVFVSRKHLQLLHDRNTSDFYLMCLSKNGVFVDDIFQRKSSEPLKLPKWFVTHSNFVVKSISNVCM